MATDSTPTDSSRDACARRPLIGAAATLLPGASTGTSSAVGDSGVSVSVSSSVLGLVVSISLVSFPQDSQRSCCDPPHCFLQLLAVATFSPSALIALMDHDRWV